jgi:hypothetical protein
MCTVWLQSGVSASSPKPLHHSKAANFPWRSLQLSEKLARP